MGLAFTVTRFILNIFGILGIAWISERILGQKELDEIHERALQLEN